MPKKTASVPASEYLSAAWIETLLKEGSPQAQIAVKEVSPFPIDNSASILVSLTAQSSSTFLGHFGLQVHYQKDGQEYRKRMVMKVKPHGREISKMLLGLATHCGEPLASIYPSYLHQTGFENTHGRETSLYQHYQSPLFPEIYGVHVDEEQDHYFILMECLDDARFLNTVMEPEKWTGSMIKHALESLAQWHATHLAPRPPIKKYWTDTAEEAYMQENKPLWEALLNHAHKQFPELYTETMYGKLQEALEQLGSYQKEMRDFPKTLVHNDANLRNACFREGEFCLYDWELADFHLPQYDVVEWLCFVLDRDRYAVRESYLEHYRGALNRHTKGTFSDPDRFLRGFHLAALDFGLHRLGMYMMAHTVSPYPFLPRVVASYADTIRDLQL